MTTGSFSGSVSAWAGKTRDRADRCVVGLTRFCLRSMTSKTPVDTGRARASWRFSVGRPDLSRDMRPEREAPGFSAAVVAGDAVLIQQYAEIEQSARAGFVIWLTNDTPYVRPLEYGYSPKGRDMLFGTFAEAVVAWPGIVQLSARGGATGTTRVPVRGAA